MSDAVQQFLTLARNAVLEHWRFAGLATPKPNTARTPAPARTRTVGSV